MPLPVRDRNPLWDEVRTAFVERETRPTYQELAGEFGISEQRIGQASNDQGWPMIRAQVIEKKLQDAGAGEIILAAMQSSRAIVRAGENFSILAMQKLIEIIEDIKKESACSTRVSLMNTAGFAYKNITDGCKQLGIVGFAKELNGAGKEGNGQWNPGVLQSINVTVQNLTAQSAERNAKAATVDVDDVI